MMAPPQSLTAFCQACSASSYAASRTMLTPGALVRPARRLGGRPVLFEITAERHPGGRAERSCGPQANA